ncbi:lecithin retinol acyltransferase domain-containing protein [Ditylenchus destructor]|uniref:Lecithin retinol acyltransferase domain-containing protein n=1 Tax=Ditylenchus destructor TaxID=166010 RepID=A0AAD4ME76_9BILA|nr:lecithin retinol acyltransferase domain-containing protein [Ditylenchus destructor]
MCEYEKDSALPEQTRRPKAESEDRLTSKLVKKTDLNPKPGDIIQYGRSNHVALYLGKSAGHIFGSEYVNYDVIVSMKRDGKGNYHIKLHDWAQEYDNFNVRIYNVFEAKYKSFSVEEMAKRAKQWIGCKVAKYSYEKYNCEHFAHKIKHGRMDSIIEIDLIKFRNESNPAHADILEDKCVNDSSNYMELN